MVGNGNVSAKSRAIIALASLLLVPRGAFCQGADTIPAGSSYRWTLRYGSISLGDARLSRSETDQGPRIALVIRSNPKLPGPPLRNEYESYLDAETEEPTRFVNRSAQGKNLKVIDYRYDLAAALMRISGEFSKGGKTTVKSGNLALEPGVLDGIGLLRMMGLMRGSGLEIGASCLGEMEAIPLSLAFRDERESIRLPSGAGTVDAYRVDGLLKGPGIAGLTGKFSVWMSADSPSVPLKAVLKLWIGEAVLELAKEAEEAEPMPPADPGTSISDPSETES